ncbi:hypothetical protein [Nocardioides cavernaquae]|uniref:hypothetical protein n=1 Tax=Nocardioides cavernaquae TaxID=2321396 RepID=UPI0011C3AF55|nr:hypothetical protein [Nocardioides cavernaquae]
MSSLTQPRGPLPARVYWTRRLILVAVALLLFVTIARVLGGGSDGKGTGDPKAQLADAGVRTSTTAAAGDATTGAAAPTSTTSGKPGRKAPLASPSGPCEPADVKVTPVIERAAGGQTVPLKLALSSSIAACTFTVSAKTIVLKIVSGKDNIWSSQQCPSSIRQTDVVVRSAVPAEVVVHWDARRSDEDCSRSAGWAELGYYHAIAATLGGEPTDTQFQLTRPPAVVVTVTPKPKATTASPSASASAASQSPARQSPVSAR